MDILHDADLFRRTYPNWPHAEPDGTADLRPGTEPGAAATAGEAAAVPPDPEPEAGQ